MLRILFLFLCCALHYVKSDNNIAEDAYLNFTQLVEKYYCGHKCEEFDVVTDDNYILTLFHIKGDETKPVLLGHALQTSADEFVIRGKSSLAITLAEKGYDVWALNVRGSKYSRRHVCLDPDTDKEFWDFSFHEMGVEDLPANIDFVLNKTNQTQLIYIGHSQGTQISFVLGSVRPEYNAKINVSIAMAPIAFLTHMRPPSNLFKIVWPPLNVVLKAAGIEEFDRNNSLLIKSLHAICSQEDISYEICYRILDLFVGPDPSQVEPEFSPVLFGHFPDTTSRKNLNHFAQVALRKKFSQYDYGLRNLELYGSLEPLDYPLKKITSPVVLLEARNDYLADIKDVKHLKAQLPNAYYHELEYDKMNHLDFAIGKNMDDYLYPVLFEALQNYTQLE